MFELILGMPLAARLLIAGLVVLLAFWSLRLISSHFKNQRRTGPKYAGLSFVATLFRVGGAITAALCVSAIILVAIIVVGGETILEIADPPRATQRAIFGFVAGVLLFGFGEVLRVLIDVSLNTRLLVEANLRIIHLLGRPPRPEAQKVRQNASDIASRNGRILEELERVLMEKPSEPLVQTKADKVAEDKEESKRSTAVKEPAQTFADALASNLDEWVAPNQLSASDGRA